MVRNKKIFNILSLSSTPLLLLSPLVVSSCSSNHENTTLSRAEVLNNFNEGGKWYGKTSLTYKDFDGYKTLDINSFDDVKLDSIELPSSIKINSNNDEIIKWNDVQEIKVYNQDTKNIFINENVLFYYQDKYFGYYVASTISNRKDKITIKFSSENNNQNSYHYLIPDYFYEENIFKNVVKISFISNQSIFYIGKSAFENCQVLDEKLVLDLNLGLNIMYFVDLFYINDKAFKNTNINSVSIINNIKPLPLKSSFLILGFEAFSNNINLKSFKYENNDEYNDGLIIDEKGFFNCSIEDIQISSSTFALGNESFAFEGNSITKRKINLIVDEFIMENNVFSGNYESFLLDLYPLQTNKIILEGKINSLTSINCNIENFNLNVYESVDNNFKNLGLTQEQFNKINFDF